MGWIGIADQNGRQFDTSGLGDQAGPVGNPRDPAALMPRGTLMLETRLTPEKKPQTLLAFRRHYPWAGSFSLQMLPGGGIILVETQGDDVRHFTLPHDPDTRTSVLRLTYSWDAPGKWGLLTLEQPGSDIAQSVTLAPPHPIPLSDMRSVIMEPLQRELHPEVDFIAVSSRVEPVGPMPGLTGSVLIATPQGETYADRLQRGDMVETASGEQVPVLHTVRRTVPARGSFRPVLIRAPYFGLHRDIVVAQQQRLVIGGSEVEYMFGKEAVLVPARHLVNGVSTRFADGPDLITYHHLLLPGHEAILAAGCPVESLYVGRLRRKPEQLASSVLAAVDRSRLPEHPKPIWPVLKPFEAITLAMHRAA
ncbi:Hint domain-containing protein [uncultured Roseovarius sp.]|uniref:Hint domain-containing protein n=1 Tax=uncultured Roseovarius sp. TaxID=293344 RepID=UPI002628E365|nr:Hint domain-containing protein [uncultured Roseovarius sp.]